MARSPGRNNIVTEPLTDREIKSLIQVRKRCINLFNSLDGKHLTTGIIQQKIVAEELVKIINGIDKILKGKVEFK